jgi:hypothetical protein
MTLVLTWINAFAVVQASDRLTTAWRHGRLVREHDPAANKTIICLAKDGPMVIAFAGVAYVGSEPTDEWIARHLIGREHFRMPDGRIPTLSFGRNPLRTFNQTVWLLEAAIQAEPAFENGLEVAVGGWRIRRRRLAQVALAINKKGKQTQRVGHMRLRSDAYGSALFSIGANTDFSEVAAAAEAHELRDRILSDARVRSGVLADAILRTSRSIRYVGGDVMIVEIPRWRPNTFGAITIRFQPAVDRFLLLSGGGQTRSLPAAFWPWIVTPTCTRAPSTSTGGSGGTLESCGWTFRFEAPSVEAPRHGILYAESSIQRPRPPAS